VEVAHANLPEVTWMELVKKDAVVVQATRVTAASRMLAVLADTAMAGRHVPPLFPVLVKMGRLRTSHGRQEQEEQSCREVHTGHSRKARKIQAAQDTVQQHKDSQYARKIWSRKTQSGQPRVRLQSESRHA